jgi:hypothetical protein
MTKMVVCVKTVAGGHSPRKHWYYIIKNEKNP